MTTSLWLDAIRSGGAVIAATPPAHLGLAVPSCPQWTAHDLITHTGAVHRWATRFLATDPDSHDRFGFDDSDAPSGRPITGWYAARLAELVERLESTDPAAPVRSFAGTARASFWFRRQAHEIAVHRWDLANVSPAGAAPIDTRLAADGVGEWIELFAPRFLARGRGCPSRWWAPPSRCAATTSTTVIGPCA